MRRLREGSEEAASMIAELYTPHLLRAVRRSLPKAIRSKVDSIDLLNTLWGSLLVRPSRLARIQEPAQLIALLTVAARNRVIEEYRKYTVCAARDVRREDPTPTAEEDPRRQHAPAEGRFGASDGDTPSQIVAAREKLRIAVGELSARDREILSLRAGGKSYREIAEMLEGVSERTARRVVGRIVERILG